MKTIKDYIIEHLKIEINNTALLLEKYGLFDGCEDIVSKVINDIKRKFRNNIRNFTLEYTSNDFSEAQNIFFEILIINCKHENYIGGEYVGIDNNINDDKTKLKKVSIDIDYSELDWKLLSSTLTHELTHAFEDYNRSKKKNIKTLKDIEDVTYTNAVSNLNGWTDSVKNIKKFLSFYIYLSNKSELNAFIASFSSEITKLNITFDLTNQDIIKEAYNIIKNTSAYKKYKELDFVISNIDKFNHEKIEDTYNDITNSNKTYPQIKKEITSNWQKIMNKLNSTIPKIICDYIDKHTVVKKIEKTIK